MNRTRDLTEGSIVKQLLVFSMPILAGHIFQNLYNSVDSIVVGRAVGTTALAAVSASADFSNLLIGFFTGFSAGSGVLIARCFGARMYKKLHDAIHTAVMFSLIIGVVIAGAGILLSPLLLRAVNCPADVYAEAMAYLRIYLVGVLFTAIYNVGAGVLRAVGDSRTPFIFLVVTSLCNIVLDILLVAVIPLGVSGAAIATVLSQLISVVLVFRRMLRTEDVYKLSLKDIRLHGELLREILELGLPAGIQISLVSFSNVFIQRYVNSFGSAAMAGMGAGKKIDRFVGMATQSLGLATATFVGQNTGAQKLERAYRGVRVAMVICLVYVVLIGGGVILLAPSLVRIFTSDDAAVSYGVNMMRIILPFYIFHAGKEIYGNAIRGFGKSMLVMVNGIMSLIVLRQLFLAVAMHLFWDVRIIYFSYPFGWTCSAAFLAIYYYVKIYGKNRSDVPGAEVPAFGEMIRGSRKMSSGENALTVICSTGGKNMEYFTLRNGQKMPAVGSGTNSFGRADSNEYTSPLIGDYSAMESALEVGYRMFDTALAYGNEEGIGNCLAKSGIPREEFFLMGKIPNRAPYNSTPQSVRESVDASLRRLKTDHFDMFMIHKAVDDAVARQGGSMDLNKTLEIWYTLTELYKEGKLRGIGVSNFDTEQLTAFLKECGEVPMVNEVRCNPACRNSDVLVLCKENGIQPIAHSPLSFSIAPGVFKVDELAKARLSYVGEKYGKSWAQVLLRYNYQNGVVSIPRSSKKSNQAASLDIFDFALTDDEFLWLSK